MSIPQPGFQLSIFKFINNPCSCCTNFVRILAGAIVCRFFRACTHTYIVKGCAVLDGDRAILERVSSIGDLIDISSRSINQSINQLLSSTRWINRYHQGLYVYRRGWYANSALWFLGRKITNISVYPQPTQGTNLCYDPPWCSTQNWRITKGNSWCIDLNITTATVAIMLSDIFFYFFISRLNCLGFEPIS